VFTHIEYNLSKHRDKARVKFTRLLCGEMQHDSPTCLLLIPRNPSETLKIYSSSFFRIAYEKNLAYAATRKIYQEASLQIVLQRRILQAEKEKTSVIKQYQVVYMKKPFKMNETKKVGEARTRGRTVSFQWDLHGVSFPFFGDILFLCSLKFLFHIIDTRNMRRGERILSRLSDQEGL